MNLSQKWLRVFFVSSSEGFLTPLPWRIKLPLYSEGLRVLLIIPPTLSLAGFHQFVLVLSERSGQGFRGLMALLTMSFLYDTVLSILMGLSKSSALNAASDKSFSDQKFLGQVNDS